MFSQLFIQITLPLMVAIVAATLVVILPRNTRTREIARPPDDRDRRLDRLESMLHDVMKTLMSIDHRLTVLEERSSPLVRG